MREDPTTNTRLREHEKKCILIQEQFLHLQDSEKIAKGGFYLSHLSRKREQKSKKIDMHNLTSVIDVDIESGIAHVEGMASFYDIVEETLKYGFIPKIIPELGGITIGGAISGLAVESTSFRFGLLHRVITEMEVITGDGKLYICKPDNEYHDLFYGMPNSYGTLGYILSAKIELIPAQPYVYLQFKKYDNLDTYFQAIKSFCAEKEKYNFIDGAIFSKDMMVIVLGQFTDSVERCSDYQTENIYYKAIQEKNEDYLTISDYIWRWDRHLFWGTNGTFLENRIFRRLFGQYILRSDRMLTIKHMAERFKEKLYGERSVPKREKLGQDIGVPIDNCKDFVEWFNENIGILPLFICPYEAPNKEIQFSLLGKTDLDLSCNIGFYSYKETEYDPQEGYYNRMIEKKGSEFNFFKSLYSSSFYPKSEFEELYYFETTYPDLKEKYDPHGRFPDLYEKCVLGH